jgi:hypothetical protein
MQSGGNESNRPSKTRRQRMNYSRIINTTVSMDNVKAAIETYLRTIPGLINNSEDVKLLTFGTIKNPTTIIEWESNRIVPLQIILKENKVEKLMSRLKVRGRRKDLNYNEKLPKGDRI